MNLRALALWISIAAAAGAQTGKDPLALATRQFENGDYRAAIELLSSALDENPNNAGLLHMRSRTYLEQGEFAKAVADAEHAVSEKPDNSEYRRWLGRAYGSAAEEARSFSMARKVRQAFETAVKLDPSNIHARRDLEQFYLEAPWIVGGSRSKALDQADAIARIDPVAGHLARASYWADDKRFGEAEAEYRAVLDLHPDRIEPYLEIAGYYETRNEGAKLAAVIEQAREVEPSDARLSYFGGVALVLGNRNPGEAEDLLRHYVAAVPRRSDFPSHADAHVWLGRLHEHVGDLDAAADEYRAALAIDPHSKAARDALRRLDTTRGRSGFEGP